VTFELATWGNEVLLTLTHRRLGNREEMISVGAGWHTHLAILAERLHGREPENFWATFQEVKAHYDKTMQ
jgi:hypothetical protein